jgi:hypothetical protein
MAIPPPPPPPAAPPPPPTPGKGSNRTVIIVLCIIGALILIIGGCVTTCAYFAHKKVKEYTQQAEKNPTMAAISLAAAVHPDIQVVSKNERTGKITLRNKKTGEVVTLDTNDFTPDGVGKALAQVTKGQKPTVETSAPSEAAETPAARTAETTASEESPPAPAAPRISAAKAASLAAAVRRFPVFVSAYPGSQTTDAMQNTYGKGTLGNYEFLTSDAAEDVADYYEKQLTKAGFTIAARNAGSNDNGSTLTLIATSTDSQSSFTLNAEAQPGGKVKGTIGFTVTKP